MASAPNSLDPRTLPDAQPPAAERDIRPVVPVRRGGMPPWLFAILAVFAALLLFMVLDARRRALTAPDERSGDRVALPAPPPPLVIPPDEAPPEPALALPVAAPPTPAPQPRAAPPPAPAPQPQIVYVPQPTPVPPASYELIPPVQPDVPRATGGPAVVIDTAAPTAAATTSGAAAADVGAAAAPGASVAVLGNRARSGVFANRSTTVVQGTLIPAVLETALDSTRPGAARAIVSRDVRGFDGTRVVIPRGSRLIGEYRSDIAAGQRRATVNWLRLIRPDGVTIAIGSPAGDPLGRGGIRAHVNSHFLERFGNALLQSILQIGGNIAVAEAANGAIIAAPGLLQGTTQAVQPSQVTPTLTVRPGTSISIFAARDLDFTGAEQR